MFLRREQGHGAADFKEGFGFLSTRMIPRATTIAKAIRMGKAARLGSLMTAEPLVFPPGPVLGIETSCDDTAAAVLAGGEVRSSVVARQLEHKAFDGVVPELSQALRMSADLGLESSEPRLELGGGGARPSGNVG